jgi:hypothetical protein
MKYLHYKIKEDEISDDGHEIASVPADFIEYKITLSGESVYYKITNGKVSDVIGEAVHEPAAKRRVQEFLSGFNTGLV